MADDRTLVKRERTRRSRRKEQAAVQPANGQHYDEAQTEINQLDDIITDILSPTTPAESVSLGTDEAQEVRQLTNEELVNRFRQQSGE